LALTLDFALKFKGASSSITEKEAKLVKGIIGYLDRMPVKLLNNNKHDILGLAGGEAIYIHPDLVNSDIALFHEAAEGFLRSAEGASFRKWITEDLKVSVHTYLRGDGSKARQETAMLNNDALEHNTGSRHEYFRGLQDKLFTDRDNDLLTALIERVKSKLYLNNAEMNYRMESFNSTRIVPIKEAFWFNGKAYKMFEISDPKMMRDNLQEWLAQNPDVYFPADRVHEFTKDNDGFQTILKSASGKIIALAMTKVDDVIYSRTESEDIHKTYHVVYRLVAPDERRQQLGELLMAQIAEHALRFKDARFDDRMIVTTDFWPVLDDMKGMVRTEHWEYMRKYAYLANMGFQMLPSSQEDVSGEDKDQFAMMTMTDDGVHHLLKEVIEKIETESDHAVLDDESSLRVVGAMKPLAYATFRKEDVLKVDEIEKELNAKGKRTKRFNGGSSSRITLYAYDPVYMEQHMKSYADLLKGTDVPTDVDGFINYVASNFVVDRDVIVRDQKKLERLRENMFRRKTNLLGSFFEFGDRSIILEGTPFTSTMGYDPSSFLYKYRLLKAEVEIPKKRIERWIYGSLADHSRWHKKLGAEWPIIAHLRKNGNFLTEPELLQRYAESAGMLAPCYQASGSGWWRPRYIHAARVLTPMHGDKSEASGFGKGYYRDVTVIEGMSPKSRREFAAEQHDIVMKAIPSWNDVVEKINTIVKKAVK
jgi:GNAT superfamily N-acetyltransferase